jgi:hypothetical protein
MLSVSKEDSPSPETTRVIVAAVTAMGTTTFDIGMSTHPYDCRTNRRHFARFGISRAR